MSDAFFCSCPSLSSSRLFFSLFSFFSFSSSSPPYLLRPQRPVPRPGSDPFSCPLLLRRHLGDGIRIEPALVEIILLSNSGVVRRRRCFNNAVELCKVRRPVIRQKPRQLRGGSSVGGVHEVDGDVRAQGAEGQGEIRRIVGEEELAAGPSPRRKREQAAEPARRRHCRC